MSMGEYAALKEAAIVLAGVPDLTITEKPAAPESAPAADKTQKRKTADQTVLTDRMDHKKERRTCAWCEKPLPKNASPLMKTHRGKCNLLYQRKCANERYRMKKPGREIVNPSDPFATEEEKKAARLEIIRRMAEKHTEN